MQEVEYLELIVKNTILIYIVLMEEIVKVHILKDSIEL